MILRKFRYNPVYRKMFLSYVLIVFLTISILSIVLFQLFSYSSIMEIKSISESMLEQTCYSSNVMYEQMLSIGTQLLNDNEVITLMFAKTKDPVLEYKILRKLTNIQSTYTFIDYISIYNGNINRYINTKTISPEIDKEIINLIQTYNNDSFNIKYSEFMPRKIEYPFSVLKSKNNILTYIMYPDFSYKMSSKYALVININADYLQNAIKEISNGQSNNLIVLNQNGVVISHSKSEFFMTDISNESFVKKIHNSDHQKGSFNEQINGTNHLVTYVKSGEMNWTFISLKPYNQLLSNIYQFRNLTIITALVLLAVGILLSLWFTHSFYNPLKNLLNKINFIMENNQSNKYNEFESLSNAFSKIMDKSQSLESSLKTVFPVLKDAYLNSLLKGDIEEISKGLSIMKDMVNQLTSPFYSVLILKIDEYKKFKQDNSLKDQALIHFAMCNISQEFLERYYKCNAINTENDHIVILVQLDDKAQLGKLINIMEEVRKSINKTCKVSISIGIGDLVSSKSDICNSYKAAIKYINYRLFYGYGSIIYFDMIKCRLNEQNKYPVKLEKNLIEAIKLNNINNIKKEAEQFTDTIGNFSYNQAFFYFNQLLMSILRHFNTTLPPEDVNFNDYYEILQSFSEIETLDGISECILRFCTLISNKIEERKNNKNIQAVLEIENYIREHYSDPNLCIESVADLIHYSPVYLGKLFRKELHTTFNNYLIEIRMEKAREYLKSTDLPISEICKKIGISNNTYFFTLFRKTYGMTPTQFRNKLDSPLQVE